MTDRQPLSQAEKDHIKAEWRASRGDTSAVAAIDPALPYRKDHRQGGAELDWKQLNRKLINKYEKQYGHSYDPKDELPDYECAMCRDTGLYMAEGTGPEKWKPEMRVCECGIGQDWPIWNPDTARVPMALRRRYTVWQPDTAAWETAQAWLASWPPTEAFFTLMGKPGNGKSNMAACMLAEIHERHRQKVAFWGVVEILDRLKATFDEDERTETTERVMAEFIGQQVLCIDDIGSSKATEWAEERLYAIIDRRMGSCRPTIITCNPSGAGWDSLHPRLKSRVRAGIAVELHGPDRRVRKEQRS